MSPSRVLDPTASLSIPSRPWLARLHPSLFGMVLGILGLSGAWQRLGRMGVGGAAEVSMGLLAGALVMLVLLLGLWAVSYTRLTLPTSDLV